MGKLFDSPVTVVLILVVILLLFGAPKLPGMARSLGQSMRIFKSEVKEMKKDDEPNVTVNGQPVADGQPVAGQAPAQQTTVQQPAQQAAQTVQPTGQPVAQQPVQPQAPAQQPGQPVVQDTTPVQPDQRPTA
ncbi:Sec-independent protein translocase subunit TatA [Kocuria rhizophila]|uniref:Sec-independent protein translocase subunit TatA n=1 Tax=Kocuria rhizophila TaxID=72000 RepID=UPI001D7A397B|nr:Sec-independent protein translocase subunit TatA [Kocuria rhizophila]MCC5673135.1 Sec-independent protein translocase subunit TatA [Kocuria rhizophila]